MTYPSWSNWLTDNIHPEDLDLDDQADESHEEGGQSDEQSDEQLAEAKRHFTKRVFELADEYKKATADQREILWGGLSDTEKGALQGLGVNAPQAIPVDESFSPVGPGDPNYQRITDRARAEVSAGLKQIYGGGLSPDAETIERIERLAEVAGNSPGERGSFAAQEAQHLIDRLRQATTPGFNELAIRKTKQYTGPDGVPRLEETDQLGNQRTRRITPESDPDVYKTKPGALPADASELTQADIAALSHEQKQEFRKRHPEKWEALKVQASYDADLGKEKAK